MVDDPVRFDLLSVNRLTVDKAVDTHTAVDSLVVDAATQFSKRRYFPDSDAIALSRDTEVLIRPSATEATRQHKLDSM